MCLQNAQWIQSYNNYMYYIYCHHSSDSCTSLDCKVFGCFEVDGHNV